MGDIQEVERTFARGPQRWRVDAEGNWSVQMFGWYPTGPSPRYQWHYVERDQVPDELIRRAAR